MPRPCAYQKFWPWAGEASLDLTPEVFFHF